MQLRLRAMFGVGARAEILRSLLTAHAGEASGARVGEDVAARLAAGDATALNLRAVAPALD